MTIVSLPYGGCKVLFYRLLIEWEGHLEKYLRRQPKNSADHGGQYGDIRWSNQPRAGVSAELTQSAAVLQEGPEALFLGVAAAAAETQCSVTRQT
jgi:hypothetical protein